MGELTRKQKKMRMRIGIAMLMFALLVFAEHGGVLPKEYHGYPMLIACIINYLIIGYDVLRKCFFGIVNRQMFDESLLMTIATVGAFGCGECLEGVAVMLFYQVGEFFQGYAVGKSRNAINELLSIAPEYANREDDDGEIELIDPDEIEIGDIIVVKPGEKIPIDGLVIEGSGYISTAALTGESMPRLADEGDEVISGCINGDSLLRIQALKLYEDSTVARILELVESAASRKSKTESFITRFARIYTPAVAISALVLALLPPLISGDFTGEFGKWVLRACSFLVISCPCALVISVPMAFFGGIGAASRSGVLVKGSNYLEMMSQIDTLVTDKTGTLTEGRFKVSKGVTANGWDASEVIRLAAAVEEGSTHPIGTAITEACDKPYPAKKVRDLKNYSGKGVSARLGRHEICVGNRKLFDEMGIDIRNSYLSDEVETASPAAYAGSDCYVARDGKYIGKMVVSDMAKPEAKSAITEILAEKVRRIVMLTGDSEGSASVIADELGISEYRVNLLPDEKVNEVQGLLNEIASGSNPKGKLAFVGDGINDAPVLSISDVGIAMGSLGSDAAIEAADIVIMYDNIKRIPMVIRIARKTIGISKVNIAFALSVKLVCLVLGAMGIANMWIAVFADVGVAMICILNSMRMIMKKYGVEK